MTLTIIIHSGGHSGDSDSSGNSGGESEGEMASPVKPSAQKVRKGPVSLRLRTYTMELDSGGDDQVCYGDAFVLVDTATGMTMNNGVSNQSGYVKSLVIHVGGTRCVTSSTGNMLNIQARIHCEGCMYPSLYM